MSNIIAITADAHTYMARMSGTGRACKIWQRGEVLVGASCNSPDQLHRIKRFVPMGRAAAEEATNYVERVWKTHLAAHLREQIDPGMPDVRFELLVATGARLYLIMHLPEAGGYSSIRMHHHAVTQYRADAQLFVT